MKGGLDRYPAGLTAENIVVGGALSQIRNQFCFKVNASITPKKGT